MPHSIFEQFSFSLFRPVNIPAREGETMSWQAAARGDE